MRMTGRSTTKDACEEATLSGNLLGGGARAALVLRDAAHYLLLMLAAAGPGGFLAGTAGGLVAHDHPFRWGLQQGPKSIPLGV